MPPSVPVDSVTTWLRDLSGISSAGTSCCRRSAIATIVLSDAHAYPRLVRNALAYAGHTAGEDRLIFAGEFADRGRDGRECLELIETSGAEVLWGSVDFVASVERVCRHLWSHHAHGQEEAEKIDAGLRAALET